MKLKSYVKKIFSKAIKLYNENEVYEDYYYLTSVVCKNCNDSFGVLIKKGYYVKDVIRIIKCQRCGCRLKGE